MSAPHPEETVLRAYAVGDLSGQAQIRIETHLLDCAACRAQVVVWQNELVAQVEALPRAGELPPLRRTLRLTSQASASRTRPKRPHLSAHQPRWLVIVLTSALTLTAGAIGWGGWQQAQANTLRAEQRQVTDWLAQPGVAALGLRAKDRPAAGHLLLLPSREVLFVLPPPIPGKVYQVWVASNWKRGDPLTPSTRSAHSVLTASVSGSDYVCISLEDKSRDMTGQTRPALILGWASL
ncbi:hypothetical protein EHF33_03535 [Deinococcus psychrotolerans]|uniref:Anti-sigma factor n=1 Tax=Deinococcus psychrotolerans TaxID=2489213 RepID=A0A3G8YCJ9_9DEIO|nr:hypothetical protein [Deinococcus psychrotolerans]AZI41937.1 hypothetical protein EHF33_03535 [Deinococcus psychrotolerans]